jgi:hypothetical protein
VNIACIQSDHDQKRYFIEADMRPNAWVDFSKYFGDDPVFKLIIFFRIGIHYSILNPVHPAYPDNILLPYFSRIKLWELAINRYCVWRIPNKDHLIIFMYLIIRKIKTMVIKEFKPLMPEGYWIRLKCVYQKSRNSILNLLM